MMRDQVTGWRPIERISVGVVQRWSGSVLRATRWVAPTGGEATVLSIPSLGAHDDRLPTVVTSPAVARDAGLAVGQYVLDPQLCWHDIDERRFLVVPALGIRVSVPVPRLGSSGTLGPIRTRPCLAVIEALPSGVHRSADGRTHGCGSGDAMGDKHPWSSTASLPSGRHPTIVTHWPVPVTAAPEAKVAPANRSTRLATGPAVFLRDDTDEPVPV